MSAESARPSDEALHQKPKALITAKIAAAGAIRPLRLLLRRRGWNFRTVTLPCLVHRQPWEAAICNHYRNHVEMLPSWREFIGWSLRLPEEPFAEDVYPKRKGLIIRQEAGKIVTDVRSWGVAMKVRGASGKMLDKSITNVRNLNSSFWKSTLARPESRCLVPFTTFAEPTLDPHPELGKKGEHWFKLPAYPVGAFAGIWRGGEYAFLTCEPCALVAPLHPKAMPVILHPEDYEAWLLGDYDAACTLAQPFPSQMMEVETVWPSA